VLCLGYKGEVIKSYFLNYAAFNSDCTINTNRSKITFHDEHLPDWNVTLVDTGISAMTGARIKRVERFITGSDFMMTYGDAVSDIDVKKLLAFHKKNKKTVTMTGVFPVYKSRFGELSADGNTVRNFTEKPLNCAALANGGFFVLNKKIFGCLKDDDDCVFEKHGLERLVKDREIALYRHDGFWYCMDTPRDLQLLNNLWDSGRPPWMTAGGKNRQGKWKSMVHEAF